MRREPLYGVCKGCGRLFDQCHCPEGDRRRAKWSKARQAHQARKAEQAQRKNTHKISPS